MFKNFIPFAHAQNIFEIDPEFFKKCGVKVLFVDLDNTLDVYDALIPSSDRPVAYIKKIIDSGIKPVLISNNKPKRVSKYAEALGIEFLASAMKPFAIKILKEISNRNLSKDDVMLVGDQMMTDVLAAYHAKIRVCLTEPIFKKDQWTTRINRLFDRPIRKHHKKKGNLIDWKEK